jgi:hypothetical protein
VLIGLRCPWFVIGPSGLKTAGLVLKLIKDMHIFMRESDHKIFAPVRSVEKEIDRVIEKATHTSAMETYLKSRRAKAEGRVETVPTKGVKLGRVRRAPIAGKTPQDSRDKPIEKV